MNFPLFFLTMIEMEKKTDLQKSDTKLLKVLSDWFLMTKLLPINILVDLVRTFRLVSKIPIDRNLYHRGPLIIVIFDSKTKIIRLQVIFECLCNKHFKIRKMHLH